MAGGVVLADRLRARAAAPSEQPRRNDFGVVEHHEVPRLEQLGKLAEPMVLDRSARPIEHHHPRRVALGERPLGDQFRGKRIIKLAQVHFKWILSSGEGWTHRRRPGASGRDSD